mmetsp:Transcript_55650/g.129571  ORF Transcript_55650/g.129571 Transcript_55650/m.129571 type:complete len:200 (+) Transcript_55650:101-700(+)
MRQAYVERPGRRVLRHEVPQCRPTVRPERLRQTDLERASGRVLQHFVPCPRRSSCPDSTWGAGQPGQVCKAASTIPEEVGGWESAYDCCNLRRTQRSARKAAPQLLCQHRQRPFERLRQEPGQPAEALPRHDAPVQVCRLSLHGSWLQRVLHHPERFPDEPRRQRLLRMRDLLIRDALEVLSVRQPKGNVRRRSRLWGC